MDENIISILKNFGWTEGFRIPVANEENKILESNAEKAYEKRKQLMCNLKQYEDKLNLVRYYLNSATEERRHYQEIHFTCKEQENIERSLCKRIKTEKDVVKKEKTKIFKKKKQFLEDNEGLQLECDKVNEKIHQMRNTLEWGKDLENAWIEFTSDGNERVELLEKWHLKNNSKLEELETKRSSLTAEKEEYDAILQQKFQNVIDTECSLNKLMKLQRKLRKERVRLITQWEWLIEVITARDNEIIHLSGEITILSEMCVNLRNKISEKKQFYDEQIRNNIRTNIDIRRKEVELTSQVILKENLTSQLEQFESKVVDHRRSLFSLKVEISERRTYITNTKIIVNREKSIVQEITDINKRTTEKHLQTKVLFDSGLERIKELVRISQEEKTNLNALLSKCKKFEARLQEQKCLSAEMEKNLVAYDYEIKELEHAKKKLNSVNQQCKELINRQTDISLELKCQLAELSKHIQFIKGDKTNQLVAEQKQELTKISNFYNYQTKILDQVTKDLEHFQYEVSNLEKIINNCNEQINVVRSDKEKLLLQMDGNEKRLNSMKESNREKLTTENVTRIKVDSLEKALAKSTDKMFDLKKQKIEIDVVVRKHNVEMQAASNILKTRKKLMNQDISSIKHHIEQIHRRIHQQMKRYEIISDGIKKDENGVPLNVTNYKIQMAKERYALLEKGDELDALVRKAEKEIQAMENTLTLLNVSNNVYKHNSLKADENEMIKYEEIKQQKVKLIAALKKIEILSEKMRNENSSYQSILSIDLKSKLHQLKLTKEKKELDYKQIRSSVDEQLFKVNRVKIRIKKVKKWLKINQPHVQVIEREFISKELLKLNKRVLQQITQLVSRHEETNVPIHQYMTAKGITLPKSVASFPGYSSVYSKESQI